MRDYLTYVQDLAAVSSRAGKTPLEASLDAGETPFPHLSERERLVGNLLRAYLELDGAPEGAPLSADTIRAEMVRYNGGRPLHCDA